ncbi:MAG: hypothetical protein QOJ51_5738 [Acidobacteriaceae bacterium]|jgi:hypothetical protein|nr:hypothetical protein [Acidobacteriaceae bacterium]
MRTGFPIFSIPKKLFCRSPPSIRLAALLAEGRRPLTPWNVRKRAASSARSHHAV